MTHFDRLLLFESGTITIYATSTCMDHPLIMKNVNPNLSRFRSYLLLGGLLITASAISLILEMVHTRISGSNNYAFLVFNLGLAWIPFAAAVVATAARRSRITFYLVMPICTLIWLMFFPNAAYLLTDFQHLAFANGNSPLWFDVIIMVWFAWTGLLLGITSLYLMQAIVTRTLNPIMGWIFAIGATILSSVGVYLGRFLRWNSWDLLQDPLPIAKDLYGIVRHPFSNLPTHVFTILFTLLFLFIYLTIHLFARIVREGRVEPVKTNGSL
ncbi:MAG: DUF1361 domain-containing protein [Anaerolineaceae bacterium]|nr:DUF1361 domain-containing protein [Anaerolineaceae bacterium]